MNRKMLWLFVVALAMGLIAAGCGDDDDESSDTGTDTVTAAPTKQEFLQQGNAICKRGGEEIDAAGEQTFGSGQPTPQELEAFASQTLIPGIQDQIDEIRALGAPEGDEDKVNSMLDKAEDAVDELEADPQGAFREGNDPFAEVNKELAAYGLTTCAEGG
jgi:hypothetical protein